MASYKLTIERIEKHPKAGEPMRDENYASQGYSIVYPDTQSTIILLTELTDEEYAACKKAVLEVMK